MSLHEPEIRDASPEMQRNATPCNIGENRLNECLSEKQAAAIEMLAAGKSLTQVAQALSIDRVTLWRWRQDEPFKSSLDERVREIWSSVADRFRGMVDPALEVMAEQLVDRYDRNRFRAAATILRLANLSKIGPAKV